MRAGICAGTFLIGEQITLFQAKIAHQLRLRYVEVEVDACAER